MKISLSRFLLAVIMFVLVIIGEGLRLRSYCLYLLCGTLIVYYSCTMVTGRDHFIINFELMTLLAFLLYSVFSFFWALDASIGLARIKVLFFLTVLAFLMTNLFIRDGVSDDFIFYYWIFGLLLSILCFLHFGISGIVRLIAEGVRLGKGKARFLGINANTIGIDCATTGVISIFFYTFREKKATIWVLIPTTIVVIATGSRKGLFVLLFGTILILFFRQIQEGKRLLPTLFKVFLISVGLTLIFRFVMRLPGMGNARDQYMGFINFLLENEEEIDLSTKAREEMIIVGWEQFLRKPFFGIGFDNAKIINWKYNHYYGYLHNNYIEILVNGGLVGFVIYYSFFIIVLIKHVKRLIEKKPIVYISLALLILRLLTDWGRVSYFDYMNIPMYSFWIAVSNSFDLSTENIMEIERVSKYIRS